MAISLYFGLPGCGKTSLAAQVCVDEAYKIKMGQSRYSCVITNTAVKCEGVYYCKDFSWMNYEDQVKNVYSRYVRGALYVIDEATLEFDSRAYKVFAKGMVGSAVLHRHVRTDWHIYVQIWNRVDKTIRDLCDRVYYVHKGLILKSVSYANHIPYSILFPEGGDNAGDIVMGYKRCPFFMKVFSFRLYRPLYYPYFDTYWIPEYMVEYPIENFRKLWLEGSPRPQKRPLFARLIGKLIRLFPKKKKRL